jgi:hypothetical protein
MEDLEPSVADVLLQRKDIGSTGVLCSVSRSVYACEGWVGLRWQLRYRRSRSASDLNVVKMHIAAFALLETFVNKANGPIPTSYGDSRWNDHDRNRNLVLQPQIALNTIVTTRTYCESRHWSR